MAEKYVYIENYNKFGTMALSKDVFETIVHIVTDNVMNHQKNKDSKKRISLNGPAKVSIRNGQVHVQVHVIVAKDQNVSQICGDLQEEIATTLRAQTELVPFRIDIKVDNVR